MLTVFYIVLLALFTAFADGFNGGGFGWNKLAYANGGPLHGRGVYYTALPHLALGWLAGGLPGVSLVLIWMIYRAAFGFPAGTTTGKAVAATFLRHAYVVPMVMLWAARFDRGDIILDTWLAMSYVAGATTLAIQYGQYVDKLAASPWGNAWDFNPFGLKQDPYNWFETGRGALYGLMTAALLFGLLTPTS